MHVAGVQRVIAFVALEHVSIATFVNLGTRKSRKQLACTRHPRSSSELANHARPSHIIENPQLPA
jgi:hypothetical protein